MGQKVSIIIRSYNEERYIGQLLETIKNQVTEHSYEIILVDSGSTDRTTIIAKAAQCIVLNIQREDFSFGRSLNLGCENSSGDFLILISAHCIPVEKTWLDLMLQSFDNPHVGIAYGRQIGGESTRFSEHQVFAKYYPDTPIGYQNDFYCNNANLALRKTIWLSLKFDENLTGLEDMHFAKRMLTLGYKVNYVREATVYHYHFETWRQLKNRYFREAMALREILPEIQMNLIDSIRFCSFAVFADLSTAFNKNEMFKNFFEIILFRICQYYGSWRGNSIHRKLSNKEKYKFYYPK